MSEKESRPADARGNPTTAERPSDRELVVARTFDAPPRLVFRAWTTPELMLRWWAPASFGITFVSCEMDPRPGGRYRFVFTHPSFPEPMAFFGRYLEVVPNERLVWTNEEAGEAGQVTTVTFVEEDGRTRLVMHDLYPSKEALEEAVASGSTSGTSECWAQLDGVLAASDGSLAP